MLKKAFINISVSDHNKKNMSKLDTCKTNNITLI